MPNVRLAAAGAIFGGCVLACALGTGKAAAQDFAAEPVGRPIQLLQMMRPAQLAVSSHSRLGRKVARSNAGASLSQRSHLAARQRHTTKLAAVPKLHRHMMVAERKRTHLARHEDARREVARRNQDDIAEEKAAAAVAPQPVATPAPDADRPAESPPFGISQIASAAPASIPALPVPDELVVGGKTVKVASPDETNEIDLATNRAPSASATPIIEAAAADAAGVPSLNAAAAPTRSPKDQVADQAATQVENRSASQIGSTSWLLQVFAALGGAVAAGAVSWFLIGSTPQRTYG
jgi:hypothetical protein